MAKTLSCKKHHPVSQNSLFSQTLFLSSYVNQILQGGRMPDFFLILSFLVRSAGQCVSCGVEFLASNRFGSWYIAYTTASVISVLIETFYEAYHRKMLSPPRWTYWTLVEIKYSLFLSVCLSVHIMTHSAETREWRHNSNDVILKHKSQRWHVLLLLFLPLLLLFSLPFYVFTLDRPLLPWQRNLRQNWL